MKKLILYSIMLILICFLLSACFSSKSEGSAGATTVSPINITPEASPSTSLPPTGTIEKTFEHNGITREYILYIPENLPPDSPLVIGLHGYSSSPWTFKDCFGWDEVADQNKFIMCYPQGTIETYSGYAHWNARLKLSTVDDVGFLSDLALYLADEYNLDKNKIFAMGFSNGGYMAYALACERPDVFRAVASVSGLMSEYLWNSYNPYSLSPEEWLQKSTTVPIPVCHIHGTNDGVIPINGTVYLTGFESGFSAKETIYFWAGINGCTYIEEIQTSENVNATFYINPQNYTQVWYYEYTGWGHFWPSEDYTVDKPSEINAQEIIWEFFSIYN
ncbi:MAG: prolyl oligopeptidase family serine peptidase [Eubacteriales bacterium]